MVLMCGSKPFKSCTFLLELRIKHCCHCCSCVIHQMIEGCPPFASMDEKDAQKAYCANERPPFRAAGKPYAHGLKE